MSNADQEHAAFEAWAGNRLDDRGLPYFLIRGSLGGYVDRATADAWEGWKARAVDAVTHPAESHAAVAAIEFALGGDDDPLEFLRYWSEGEFDVLRESWPEAPDSIYVGADPLHRPPMAGRPAIGDMVWVAKETSHGFVAGTPAEVLGVNELGWVRVKYDARHVETLPPEFLTPEAE